MKAINYTVPSI